MLRAAIASLRFRSLHKGHSRFNSSSILLDSARMLRTIGSSNGLALRNFAKPSLALAHKLEKAVSEPEAPGIARRLRTPSATSGGPTSSGVGVAPSMHTQLCCKLKCARQMRPLPSFVEQCRRIIHGSPCPSLVANSLLGDRSSSSHTCTAPPIS